ncbi:MAG: hypothetical protein WC260_01450 [Candidatus Pacearchaeota archaeon]
MFVYKGVEYKSKAEAVRVFYDNGKLLDTPESKKKYAKEFGMTVQSVHGRIRNHLSKTNKSVKKTNLKKNIEKKIAENLVTKRYDGKRAVYPNNTKSDSKKEIHSSDPHKIYVTWAPNPWGLPITTPPIPVIDPKFKNEEEAREFNTIED